MSSDERPLRLLSLDGGGVRGLSIIYILKDVMRRVNLGRDEALEPWQYFDMIGGTSTGGIIAIMLGRLKMTLNECERAYLDLSKDIFTPSKSNYHWVGKGVDIVKANGKFDATALENAIKKVIGRHSTSSEVELLSNPEPEIPECKVFVCAIQSSKFDTTPVFLRTYKNDAVADLFSEKFKIWQACRATSAASTFFDPFVLQNGPIASNFLDGGIMLNNPVNSVFQEAQEVWGRERPMSLISVGTGDAPSGQFHGNLKNVVNGLAKIATDSRNAAEQFYNAHLGHPQLAGNYFRLNVSGMGTIGLEEHELCTEIEHATGYYLQTGETKTKLEKCVESLLETEKQGQTKQLNEKDIVRIKEFTRDLYQRSSKYGDINRVPQHSRNTCEWFLEHPKFVQWQQSTEASALWVTADAGCGKSVLARFLIGHLADGHQVIHFFFHHSRYDMNDLLCALLHQLLMLVIESSEAKSSTMLHILRDELKYKKGEDVMDEDEKLWNIICNATTGADPESPKLFCVIDGLDECEEQSRSPFIELIASAFSSSGTARQPHQPPKILITSRPYPLIEERFRPLSLIRLRLENETPAISKDIETMITGKIQKLNPGRFPPNLQDYLHAEISRKAGRTFLWVKLIFDALEQLPSTTMEEIRKLLDTNPSELETLYESSLSCTKDRGRTRRLLQILIAAARPLNLEEVNVALQIRDNCVYFEDIDLEPDIEYTIKRLCGSVIRIINSTVDFMHQTAKEFLTTSQYSPGKSQDLTWGASINVASSHCVLGSICLWYLALTNLDEKLARWRFEVNLTTEYCGNDGIQAEVEKPFPFYGYAGRNWLHHSNEALQRIQRAHEARHEPLSDFRPLQAWLTSLRESGMSTIRKCFSARKTRGLFLGREDLHSVVDWFLTGPHIEDYPGIIIVKIICDALLYEKCAPMLPLVQYITTIIGNSRRYSTTTKNRWFSRVANAAVANCRIPIVEHLQNEAEIVFNKVALRRGMYIAVVFSNYSDTAKLIQWGAKDYSAESLLTSLRPSSRNQQITLLLFRTQDYRNASQHLTPHYSTIFSQWHFNQGDQYAKETEIFKYIVRCLLDMPLRDYIYALLEAIRWRHPNVDFLIESRVDLTHATKEHSGLKPGIYLHARARCALHEIFSVACRYGSPFVSLLFEFFHPAIDLNQADVFGITPLVAAILGGDYSLCEWLLRNKADASVCLPYQHTSGSSDARSWAQSLGLPIPLNMAHSTGRYTGRFSTLVPYPTASDTILPELNPPRAAMKLRSRDWIWSSRCSHIPSIWNRYGNEDFSSCPLAEALRVQNLQIFELLLEHGGDPWQDYETGISVLQVAASYSETFFDQVVDLIRTKKIDLFDVNTPERNSRRTLLHVAATNGFWNSITKLILEGSIVNVADATRGTPLHAIASFPPTEGRIEAFKKLVEDHNADVNMENNDGKTAIDLLEDSILNVRILRQNRDSIQTWAFLKKLGSQPSYLPSIRRTLTMLERDDTFSLAFSDFEIDFDMENSSDRFDLRSGLGSDVDPETMSDIHSSGDERSDADDHLGYSQTIPGNTSASQPHEERGLFL